MDGSRGLLNPDARDTAQWHNAVRYGIGLELRKKMEPERDVPERFRDLVNALEKAEQDRRSRQV